MIPTDEAAIRQWAEARTQPVVVTVLKDDSDRYAPLAEFIDRVAALAPLIAVKRKSADDGTPAPALAIRDNLRFQTVATGQYLASFLDALAPAMPSEFSDALAALSLPARLTLFIAHGCPHCPKALARLLPLAHATPMVDLTVVDGALFSDLADTHAVKAVPTLILDDAFRWTGTIDVPEVAAMMVDRDPVRLGAATLRQTIESGHADRLARMMAERGTLFPAIFDLLAHPRWSVRLGAMVVMESLAEYAPPLAESAVPALLDWVDKADPSAHGDLICTLGTVGNTATIDILNSLSDRFPDPDIQEAVAEAIEAIALRT